MVFLLGCAAPALNGDAMPPALAPDSGDVDASLPGDPHGDPDAGVDAGDAGVDTPAVNLAELCGGTAPEQPADWERCYQRRWCEWDVGCEQMNAYLDVEDCIKQSDDVELGRFTVVSRANVRAAAQDRAMINPRAFTQCLLDLDGARCNTAMSSAACATRYMGTIEDGESCYTDVECASPGATCESATTCGAACCLGTCQPSLREGASCISGGHCAPGLVCYGTCKSGDVGTPCFNFRDCDASAWCDHGTCAAAQERGSACTSETQCGGDDRCLGISITDSAPGTCTRSSRPGDPCRLFCFGNLYCDASETCRELPVRGEPCTPLIPCGGQDTVCSDGRCVARGGVDASCRDEPCLPGLYCDTDFHREPTCALRRVVGDACTDDSQCKSYLCSTQAPRTCLAWSDRCTAPVR